MNEDKETSEEYYNRYSEYLKLMYSPTIPKDENSRSGYDESSREYIDSLVAGTKVPSMFISINERDIKYNTFGNIRVVVSEDRVVAINKISNIKLKVPSEEDPTKYELEEQNITLTYSFKKNQNDYQLYYLSAETYFDDDEEITSNDDLKQVYDYSKLNSLTQANIDDITNNTKQNVMYLTSNYNNYVVGHANGIVINDGLLVTTWSFIEEALINAQYITVVDSNNTAHQLDGIVTVNIDSNIVKIIFFITV